MYLRNIYFLFHIAFYLFACNGVYMEPSCSSFEFEKKMLENTVRLEYEYKLSNKKVSDELTSLNDEKTKFIKEITEAHERQIADVKNVVAKTTAELVEMKASYKSEMNEKMKTMDAIFINQQATIKRLSHDLHEMKNKTMKEIIEQSRTDAISFRASLSSQISVTPGTTIVFQDVKLNHGNGYDPSTGHFTAPVNGTYMFIVSVCPQYKTNMIINIVVDGTVYTRGLNNDDHQNNCYSYSDVIDLVKGMQTWIICGTGSGSSIYLYTNAPYHQNIFAGYLL